jgi:hypothetical protein
MQIPWVHLSNRQQGQIHKTKTLLQKIADFVIDIHLFPTLFVQHMMQREAVNEMQDWQYHLRLHLLTLQWRWGLNSKYCPGWRSFKFTISLNAFKTVHSAPRPAACEELKVHTVHWGQHYRVNKHSLHQKIKSILVWKLLSMLLTYWSQDTVVSIVTRLWAGWSRVQVLAEANDLFVLQHVKTGSGAHVAPSSMGTRCSFPGGKVVRVWVWPFTSIQCQG